MAYRENGMLSIFGMPLICYLRPKANLMAKNKTTENEGSVSDYLNAIADAKRRSDSTEIVNIMAQETGLPPKMWGPGIVGFGSYHYKYASGHEGDMPLVGMACRVNAIVLYLAMEYEGREELMQQFGKHKTSKACIYIKKIEDINVGVFRKMVRDSVNHMKKTIQPNEA